MDDRREHTQADKAVPPWERPGCFRRDCEPHRGEIVTGMAIAGLIVSQVSMCLPLLLVIGMPLNAITWYLARLDGTKMRKGLMDPSGEKVTAEARQTAGFAFALGIFWAAAWAALLLMLG